MAGPIRQEVRIDAAQAVRELDRLGDSADTAGKAVDAVDGTRVDVDADAALRELAQLDTEARRIADRKLELRAELDAHGVDDGLQRVRRAADDAEASTRKVGGAAVSSLGPLRDVSGAIGDVGVAGLNAGEGLIGVAESLEMAGVNAGALTTVLPAVGLGLGAVSIAAGLVGKLMSDARKRAEEFAAAVKAMRTELQGGASGLEVAGSAIDKALKGLSATQLKGLLQTMRDLGVSLEDVQAAANGKATPALERFARKQAEAAAALAKGATPLANGKSALQAWADANGMAYNAAVRLATGTDQLTEALGPIVPALIEAQAQERLLAQVRAQGVQVTQSTTAAEHALAEQADDTAAATDQLTASTDRLAESVDAAAAAVFAYDDRLANAWDALVEGQAAIRDTNKSLGEQKEAVRRAGDAAVASLGTEGALGVLQQLANNMKPGSPIRVYTEELIAKLQAVATDWYVDLHLNTQGVDWNGLEAMRQRLLELLRLRNQVYGPLPPGAMPFSTGGAAPVAAHGAARTIRPGGTLGTGRALARSVDRWQTRNGGLP